MELGCVPTQGKYQDIWKGRLVWGKKKGNQQPEGKGGLLQDTQVDGSYQYLTHLELQGGKEKEKGDREVNAGRMQSERPVFAYVCLISR